MAEMDIDGATLRYTLSGPEGAPVVMFSNSLGTTLEMWGPQAETLAERYQVLLYDTRGHGQSSLTPGPYTVPGLGDDALALLDKLSIDQVHFCGLSLGGLTGQAIALKAPERLLSLTLANTSAHIPGPEMWNTRIAKVQEGGMDVIADATMERWFTPTCAPDVVARMKTMLTSIHPEGYIACSCAVRDADFRAQVAAISLKTLVISGEGDAATPPAMGLFLAETIPGARYVEIKSAGHISNLEQVDAFTTALTSHLDAI